MLCYSARPGTDHGSKDPSCNAKDGNPFGSFWDKFNVDFDESEFYGPLSYDPSHASEWKRWFVYIILIRNLAGIVADETIKN